MLSHSLKITSLLGLISIFFFGISNQISAQCGNELLLNSWNQRGPSNSGNWVVAADNKSVLQTVNGQPTFFVSPDSIINTTVRGSFSVNTTSDNDYIGFVFGFRGPVGTGTDYDFYLFDWKQGNQGAALEGFTLSKINSALGSADFWGHTGAGLTVLDSKYSTTLGWADNTLYAFELTFTDTTILIKIDGDTIFDVAGTYQNGLFGFYNYSQAQVQYNNFTDNACPVAQSDSAEVIEYGATTVPVLANDTDADVTNILSVNSIYVAPINGTAQITSGGNNLLYIPNPGFSGTDSLQYIVSDGVGGQDTAWVYFVVIDVNGPHALDFAANSDFVAVPHDVSLEVGATQNLTLEMWIKTDGTMSGHQKLVQKGTAVRMEAGMVDGKITAVIDDGLNVDSAISANRYDDGKWHQIALVLDRGVGIKIYVDGNADGTDNNVIAGSLTNTDDLIIGGDAAMWHFEGLIDEVRVWGAALTQADIQRFKNIRVPKTDALWPHLVAYYQLDRGVGTQVYDYSSFNNNGALTSSAWRALSPANLSLTGDTFVTEDFTYPYNVEAGDTCSRLYNYQWLATNGTVGVISSDSLEAEITWGNGQPLGMVNVSAAHSNWGGSETAALAVAINPPVTYVDSIAICEGDSILIGGTWQKMSVNLNDTLATANGFDSIYDVKLYVIPTVFGFENLIICDGDSAYLGGAWQNTDGTYIDILVSGNGCDSILSTNLQIENNQNISQPQVAICQGDSTLIFGIWRNTAGIFYDSLTNAFGCDSIISQVLVINVGSNDTIATPTSNAALQGTFSTSQFTNANGCDSVVTIQWIYQPGPCTNVDSVTINSTTCDSTMAGITTQTLVGNDGCDSVVTIITVYDAGHVKTLPSITLCDGETATVFGKTVTKAGVYYDSLVNINGCDSVCIQNVNVKPAYADTAQVQICEGDSIYVGGMYRSVNGTYVDSLNAMMGCDSLIYTKLNVIPSITTSAVAMVCEGDSLMLNGNYQTMAGTYTASYTAMGGCDSVHTITLSVKSIDSTSVNTTICQGDSILLGGAFQGGAGIYYDTFSGSNGCDSVVITTLSIKPNFTVFVMDSICPGDSIYVGGTWQTTVGIFTDIFTASNGCDSVLNTALSIRTDSGCVADTTTQGCVSVLSNHTWMKSTVVSPSNFSGFWPGVISLPAVSTYTEPVVLGQPYGYPSINAVEGADVISTGSSITFFRKEFALDATGNLSVRMLTTVDDQAEIYLNGQRVALVSSFGRANFKYPAHDVKWFNGSVSNGYLGGDAFDVVSSADLDTILKSGINELVVAVRNLGKNTDKGGLSFRMDINCDDNIITKKSSDLGISNLGGLIIYPNPVKDILNIQSDIAITSLRVFNMSGKMLLDIPVELESNVEINMSELPKGVYMIEIQEVGENSEIQKINKM